LLSLDLFRGLAVAGMVLVTDPGTYSAVYWPLLHAQWDRPTPTDMIFPAFLFGIGAAIAFSISSRLRKGVSRSAIALQVLQRSLILCVIGLVINALPTFNMHVLRLPGVLQRIALCYLCGSLIYLASRGSGKERSEGSLGRRGGTAAGIAILLLVVNWLVFRYVPVPEYGAGHLDSLRNVGAYVDRAIFGVNHMWAYGLTAGYGVTFDPEGVLSTMGALVNLLIAGIIFGVFYLQHKAVDLFAFEQPSDSNVIDRIALGNLILAGFNLLPAFPMDGGRMLRAVLSRMRSEFEATRIATWSGRM